MREHLIEILESILARPQMWGSLESVELQFLLVLDILSFHDQKYFNSYEKLALKNYPHRGALLVSGYLEMNNALNEKQKYIRLVEFLKDLKKEYDIERI